MTDGIVVPVDFSKASLRALDHAVDLSRRLKRPLTVLHVVEPVFYPAVAEMYGVGLELSNVYGEIESAARAQLERLARTLRARRVAVRTLLVSGTAHQGIADAAKRLKAGLIVMASHGRTGISHVLLGSVAERVLRAAPCPVLIVRPSGPSRRRRATARTRPRPRRGAPPSRSR